MNRDSDPEQIVADTLDRAHATAIDEYVTNRVIKGTRDQPGAIALALAIATEAIRQLAHDRARLDRITANQGTRTP